MGANEGRYGCTQGPIMGFESRPISAQVTKQLLLFLIKYVIRHIRFCYIFREGWLNV